MAPYGFQDQYFNLGLECQIPFDYRKPRQKTEAIPKPESLNDESMNPNQPSPLGVRSHLGALFGGIYVHCQIL